MIVVAKISTLFFTDPSNWSSLLLPAPYSIPVALNNNAYLLGITQFVFE
jgi:hypothetical protein